MRKAEKVLFEGGCLCRGVRYQIVGPARDVINCHCENCRRTHGNFAAYTSVSKADLKFISDSTLTWYHDESPDTLRGFCNDCGASLFWDAQDGKEKMAVAAGSLDDGKHLKTIGHIFVDEAANYTLMSDGLPRFAQSSDGKLGTD
ncbi:MAG: hypothetical protein ACI9LO_000332 [Planctomycetota bacterium]|jgi:hypothetical protein